MLLTEADLDEGDDLTLDQAAQRVLTRMEAQRTALRDQYNPSWLALSAGKTAAGLLALGLFYYVAWRSWRWFRRVYRLRIVELTCRSCRRTLSCNRRAASWWRKRTGIALRLYRRREKNNALAITLL